MTSEQGSRSLGIQGLEYYRNWNTEDILGKCHLSQIAHSSDLAVPGSQIKAEKDHIRLKAADIERFENEVIVAAAKRHGRTRIKNMSSELQTRVYMNTVIYDPMEKAETILSERDSFMNKKTYTGDTPKEIAKFLSNVEANRHHYIGFACACGFKSIDYQSPESGDTFLHIAVRRGHIDTVRELLKYRADPDLHNKLANCPVHEAWMFWKTHATRTKEERELQEKKTCQILHEIFSFGGFVDSQDQYGQTALHIACRLGTLKAVTTILGFRANYLSKTFAMQSPIDIASEFNKTEIVKLLSIWDEIRHKMIHVDFIVLWKQFLNDFEAVISNEKSATAVLFELEMETSIKRLERGSTALQVDDPLLLQSFQENRNEDKPIKPWDGSEWKRFVHEAEASGIVDLRTHIQNLGKKHKGTKKAPRAVLSHAPTMLPGTMQLISGNMSTSSPSNRTMMSDDGTVTSDYTTMMSRADTNNSSPEDPVNIASLAHAARGIHFPAFKKLPDKLPPEQRLRSANILTAEAQTEPSTTVCGDDDGFLTDACDEDGKTLATAVTTCADDEGLTTDAIGGSLCESCGVEYATIPAANSSNEFNGLFAESSLLLNNNSSNNTAGAGKSRGASRMTNSRSSSRMSKLDSNGVPRPLSEVQQRRLMSAEIVCRDALFLKFTKRPAMSSPLFLALRTPQAPLVGTDEESNVRRLLTAQGKDFDMFEKTKRPTRREQLLGKSVMPPKSTMGAYTDAVEMCDPSDRDQMFSRLNSKPDKSTNSYGLEAGPAPDTVLAMHASTGRKNKIDLINNRRSRFVEVDLLPPPRVLSLIEKLAHEKADMDLKEKLKKQGLTNAKQIEAAKLDMQANLLKTIEEDSIAATTTTATGEADAFMHQSDENAKKRQQARAAFFLNKPTVVYGKGRLTSSHNMKGALSEYPWEAVTGRYAVLPGDRTC